jgi:hypothetical protein
MARLIRAGNSGCMRAFCLGLDEGSPCGDHHPQVNCALFMHPVLGRQRDPLRAMALAGIMRL